MYLENFIQKRIDETILFKQKERITIKTSEKQNKPIVVTTTKFFKPVERYNAIYTDTGRGSKFPRQKD